MNCAGGRCGSPRPLAGSSTTSKSADRPGLVDAEAKGRRMRCPLISFYLWCLFWVFSSIMAASFVSFSCLVCLCSAFELIRGVFFFKRERPSEPRVPGQMDASPPSPGTSTRDRGEHLDPGFHSENISLCLLSPADIYLLLTFFFLSATVDRFRSGEIPEVFFILICGWTLIRVEWT